MGKAIIKSIMFFVVLLLIFVQVIGVNLQAAVLGSWDLTAPTTSPGISEGVTLLGNGKVLVVGGHKSTYPYDPLSGAMLYDPLTNTWTSAGSMNTTRTEHATTPLSDGRVFVVGGTDKFQSATATAEIYDPSANTWKSAASMVTPRYAPSATLLNNGKVLVVGGGNYNVQKSAELYDPITNTWSSAGSMSTTRHYHTATLLPNGKVLVAGGLNNSMIIESSAELYDPMSNTWTSAGNMVDTREWHTAILLDNGKVLVTGGDSEDSSTLSSAELYDPITNSWSLTAEMNQSRAYHAAVLLNDGKVLVASDGNSEIYDPAANTWTYSGDLKIKIGGALGTILKSGSVFLMHYNSSEIYTPNITSPTVTIAGTHTRPNNYVHLEWGTQPNPEYYKYMVYKRDASGSIYQSIPIKDSIKVLNIYPPYDNSAGAHTPIPTITFTDWKGNTYTLPKSASLKKWMTQAYPEDSKGFGKGKIDVDAVSIPDFNANPNNYLKNADGTWKYDVMVNGIWDWNGGYDLDANSLPLVKKFIESGHGYLTGHDTMSASQTANIYTRKIRDLFNIKVGHYYGYWSGTPDNQDYNNPSQATYPSSVGGTSVRISRKGLLVNYPWSVGDLGSLLHVMQSHTLSQYAFGDVWLKYTNDDPLIYMTDASGTPASHTFAAGTAPDHALQPNPPINPTEPLSAYNDDPYAPGGTNNFYLTTWNNTAMIQIGHYYADSTTDEKKLLANTIFYLAQISDTTTWDDHSAQDLAAPEKVNNIGAGKQGGNLIISVNIPNDNGSDYYYKVKAIKKNGGQEYWSPETGPVNVTTGVKGYYFTIDKNPVTNINPYTSNYMNIGSNITTPYPLDFDTSTYYLHIRTVDFADNISDTANLTIPPELKLDTVTATGDRHFGGAVTLRATGENVAAARYRIFYTSSDTAPDITELENQDSPGSGWSTDLTNPQLVGDMDVSGSANISRVLDGANFKSSDGWKYVTFKVYVEDISDPVKNIWKYSEAYSLIDSSIGIDEPISYVGHNQIIRSQVATSPTTVAPGYNVNTVKAFNVHAGDDKIDYRLEFDLDSPAKVDGLKLRLDLNSTSEDGIQLQLDAARGMKLLKLSGTDYKIITPIKTYDSSAFTQTGEGTNAYTLTIGSLDVPTTSGRYAIEYYGDLSVVYTSESAPVTITNEAELSYINKSTGEWRVLQSEAPNRKMYINTLVTRKYIKYR